MVAVVKHKDGTYSVTGITFTQLKGLAVQTGCCNANPFDTFPVFDPIDDAVREVEPDYGVPYEHLTIDLNKLSKGE